MVSFQSKIGTWLALTALALQLVLSFAHVHFAGAFSPLGGAVISGATIETYKLPIPEPADTGDEYCALCASIHLVASSVVPQAPQLAAFIAFPNNRTY
jgi:hypothetical protein